MAEPDLNTYLSSIPTALNDLGGSHKNINQIAEYCKSAYAQDPDPNVVFKTTQNYIKDALANVAYHIQNVGQQLNNFLILQTKEINKIDLQIQTITDRLRVAKDSTGASAFRNQDAVRPYQKRAKVAKLEEREIPSNSRPQQKYIRVPINLRILDTAGVDLQGNRGNEVYKTISEGHLSTSSETLNASQDVRSNTIRAPPPMMNAPANYSTSATSSSSAYSNTPPPLNAPNFPPHAFSPPPPMATVPPPPMNNMMPPPPSDFGLPPPPPPNFEFDLPPPPPPL